MAKERHADPETINYIIDLRKRLAEAERQRDHALDRVMGLRDENLELRLQIVRIDQEEERNC